MSSRAGVGAARRPVRGGEVETLDKDILPENAKEIAKEAPQVKSAHWAADERKKGAKSPVGSSAAEITSLEALSLSDVGTDDADIPKAKKEHKPKVEEKKIEEKKVQKLEIKRPADGVITPTPTAPASSSTSSSSSSSSSIDSKGPLSPSSSLSAAAPLREGRGLYRQAGGRTPLRAKGASSSSSSSAKLGLTAAASPSKEKDAVALTPGASPSSSSHFDLMLCIQWLSTHLAEQSWEDELAEDADKRQAFLNDVEKKWSELDLEGRGYFTAEHLVQLYWSQSTGQELDDMPVDKEIDQAIKKKAQQVWNEVHPQTDEDEDEDEDDYADNEDDAAAGGDGGNDEESERARARKAAAKAVRKRWSRQSVTFWNYVNYLLQKAEYEQLQVSAPPQPWARAYFPSR